MFRLLYSILGWGSFCMNYCINAAWHGDDRSVALPRCNEAQVALIASFRSSVLLDLVSLIIYSLWGSGLVSLLASQAHQHHGHLTSFWYLWQCWQVPSPAGKWNQHLHKACQQKEAWSALKSPVDGCIDCGLQKTQWTNTSRWHCTQIITDCGNFTLDFKQHGFCVSPLFLISPVIFLLIPGKMLLTMFLVQKWFGSSFPEDVWARWLLMHWLQLQFTPCEALSSVWISFSWQYSQACGHPCCLCTFSYPMSSFLQLFI